MKSITLLLLLFVSLSYSQGRTKTERIYKNVDLKEIRAVYSLDDNNKLTISYLVQDGRYQYLDEYFHLYFGDAKGFYTLLNEWIAFFNDNEIDVSGNVQDTHLNIIKMLGKKMVMIYDKDVNAYSLHSIKRLEKVLQKFTKWCDKNNIEYK